jgi:hypothetical protein
MRDYRISAQRRERDPGRRRSRGVIERICIAFDQSAARWYSPRKGLHKDHTQESNMAKAPLKLPAKEAADIEAASPPDAEIASTPNTLNLPEKRAQQRTTEPGRFWLQIDRQTKSSYDTAEAAATAGILIKKQFSMVQVAVYDRKEGSNQILELPV